MRQQFSKQGLRDSMVKHKLTVFVGDIDEGLSMKARSYSSDAYLLDLQRFKELVACGLEKDTTVYTCLADLGSAEPLHLLINMADEVFYCPPATWSDSKVVDHLSPDESSQGLTEYLLLEASDRVKIVGLEAAHYRPEADLLRDRRKSDDKQLWFAGCSTTLGIGVNEEQRYPTLTANKLNLPYSVLASVGMPLTWAAGQIIRSDIRKKDTVIWGITSTNRFSIIYQGKSKGITVKSYQIAKEFENIIPSWFLYSETNFFHNLYAIDEVINFCNKVGCNLLMIGIHTNVNLIRYLKTKTNFYQFPYTLDFKNGIMSNQFLDFGFDNIHPGKLQHEKYAEFCVNKLKDLNFI